MSKSFDINGTIYLPLFDSERARQLEEIAKTREMVEEFHKRRLTDKEQIEELARCMGSFEHFCTYYIKTLDPRIIPASKAKIPFILYNFQVEAARKIITAIETGQDLLIEKSRDMGATWLVMSVLTWCWLFQQNFEALVGSRVENLVDNGSPDSLLGKADFIIRNLPQWMLKQIPYDEKACRKNLQRSTYEGGLLSGESANQNFGRGVRKAVVYVDEMAYLEFDRAIWTGIGDVAPCKIVASTPCGDTNQFAELRFGGKIAVQTFHWTQHPNKTFEWYQEECKRRTPQAVASELDIDYHASAGAMALPELILNKSKIVIPQEQLDPKDWIFDMGLDYGTSNPSALLVLARAKTKRPDERWPRQKAVWEFYEPSNVEKLSIAIQQCPYYSLINYIWADPSMFFLNQTGDDGKSVTSLAQLFRDYYNIQLSAGKRGDSFVLNQIKLMWSEPTNISFEIFENCPHFIEEMESMRFQSQSSMMAQRRNLPEKLVDKNNHLWDAFKYYFNQTFNAENVTPITKRKLGWEDMNEQMSGLMKMKLERLTKPAKPNRRLFRW